MNSIIDDLKHQYKFGGVTQKLIFWNITIFFIGVILFYNFKNGVFDYPSWIALYSNYNQLLFKPWTLISYMFLHAGIVHLLFNLLMLHFVSRFFLTFFNERQLLSCFLLGGFFAGLVYVVIFTFFKQNTPIVGSSGSVMSLLIAATTYAPYYILQVPLVGKIKLWYVTGIILSFDVLQLLLVNTGGHVVHLSGGLFGYIFVVLLKSGIDVTKPLNQVSLKKTSKNKTPFSKIHVNKNVSNFSNTKANIEQKQVDDILDKISKSGYDSLSKSEKEFLFKLGK
ncbi:MAG TPA: rhomboid family intramembrane serine protease [Flavobacterium sp.]|nr:rhomboid family intramembrane serine protease [Flavobacterium sp.]